MKIVGPGWTGLVSPFPPNFLPLSPIFPSGAFTSAPPPAALLPFNTMFF